MAKRIFREWQHPRDAKGQFARKGSPAWVAQAAEKFRNAPAGLKAGTTGPGQPGGRRLARGAKAEALFAQHDASRTTRLAPTQPVQGPARPPVVAKVAKPRFEVREMAVKGRPMFYVVDGKGNDVARYRDRSSAEGYAVRAERQVNADIRAADQALAQAAQRRTPERIQERYSRAADRVARLDGDNLDDRESRAAYDELAKARNELEAAQAAGLIPKARPSTFELGPRSKSASGPEAPPLRKLAAPGAGRTRISPAAKAAVKVDTSRDSGQAGGMTSTTKAPDGVRPTDGRPDVSALLKMQGRNRDYDLGNSRGRSRSAAPDAVRAGNGFMDGQPASAEILNPTDGTGDYRYRIYNDQTGATLEEGTGRDLADVKAKVDRIYSSQRGGGMARTAGNEVRYEARSVERKKDPSRGDFGRGPFYDHQVVEVRKDGSEFVKVKTSSASRAAEQAAEMNAKEGVTPKGAIERASDTLDEIEAERKPKAAAPKLSQQEQLKALAAEHGWEIGPGRFPGTVAASGTTTRVTPDAIRKAVRHRDNSGVLHRPTWDQDTYSDLQRIEFSIGPNGKLSDAFLSTGTPWTGSRPQKVSIKKALEHIQANPRRDEAEEGARIGDDTPGLRTMGALLDDLEETGDGKIEIGANRDRGSLAIHVRGVRDKLRGGELTEAEAAGKLAGISQDMHRDDRDGPVFNKLNTFARHLRYGGDGRPEDLPKPGAAAPKGAIERASDAIAEQRGLPKTDIMADEPGPARITSARENLAKADNPAADYGKNNRATNMILARQRGISGRGKSNDELVAALKAHDEAGRAKRAAKLNPGSVGAPSTQHEQHTATPADDLHGRYVAHYRQRSDGELQRAAEIEGVSPVGRDRDTLIRALAAKRTAEDRAIETRNAVQNRIKEGGGTVRVYSGENRGDRAASEIPGTAAAKRAAPADPAMTRLSDDQVLNGLRMRGNQSPEGQRLQAEADRRGLNRAAAPRPEAMRDVYARHASVTRAEFDAMPQAQREQVLADLRKVRDSGEEQRYHTRSAGIGSPPASGMRRADHVQGAETKIRELTRVLPNKDDYTAEGRARRAAAGDPNAIDGTMEELQAISAANKWGYVGSWKKTKALDYLRDRAVAGSHYPGDDLSAGGVATGLRGASQRQAIATLDALDAQGLLSLTTLQQVAGRLGVTKLTGKDKRAKMHDLAQKVADLPKAEAAREAAPGGGAKPRDIGGMEELVPIRGDRPQDGYDAHGKPVRPGDTVTIATERHNRTDERVRVLDVGTGKKGGSALATVQYASGDREQLLLGNLVRTDTAEGHYLDNLSAELSGNERAARSLRGQPSALDLIKSVRGQSFHYQSAALRKEARKHPGPLGDRLNQAADDLVLLGRGTADRSVVDRSLGVSKAAPETPKAPPGPATGAAALEAAPLRIHLGKLRNTPQGMTPQQAQAAANALEHYRDIGYLDLNRDLRIGSTNNKTIARTMEGLRGAFAASPLQRDVVTYRGTADLKMIGNPGPGSAVGKTWTDAAPGSTTIDEATARGFGQGGAVLRITVPKGVGAVQLSDAPGRGKPDDREGELLLQDGLIYRVTGDRTERGVRVLDVEASRVDTSRDSRQTGGVSNAPTTEATMTGERFTTPQIRAGEAGPEARRFERDGVGASSLEDLKAVRDNERLPEAFRRDARSEINRRGAAANKASREAAPSVPTTGSGRVKPSEIRIGDMITADVLGIGKVKPVKVERVEPGTRGGTRVWVGGEVVGLSANTRVERHGNSADTPAPAVAPAAQPGLSAPFNPRVADGGGDAPRIPGESDFAYRLRTAPSDDYALRILNGYNAAGLRAIARDEQVPVRSGASKPDLINAIMEIRRRWQDSQAIRRG